MTAKEEASVFVVVRSGTPNTILNFSINNSSSSGKTKTSTDAEADSWRIFSI